MNVIDLLLSPIEKLLLFIVKFSPSISIFTNFILIKLKSFVKFSLYIKVTFLVADSLILRIGGSIDVKIFVNIISTFELSIFTESPHNPV